MGPPAVLIVVRHGARLDAADKMWHLTSPTPYDPPLTYGGWTQSKALGARIASILRSRETDDDISLSSAEADANTTPSGRKRRHKVIIHSSPFLRCVQTSIAISVGLAQNPGHVHTTPSSSSRLNRSTSLSTPRITLTDSPRLAPIHEPSATPGKLSTKNGESAQNIKKSTVRVDAFLGEWLSPDYFELITPPPSSIMMVAGAKADLLRREDYNHLINARDKPASNTTQFFPGGWGSPTTSPDQEVEEGPLSSISNLNQVVLPRRDRTSSLSSASSSGSRHGSKSIKISAINPTEHGIYQSPHTAGYAVSNSDPIPVGYVAHARDACVDVDYQWDSMREPQNWGNGGEYGEEWSSMHKRFRKGLQQLVSWYQEHDVPGIPAINSPARVDHASSINANDDDEDTDLVIILVTHGAGCNALIGAMTNQPVLLDVGMASLTMAVRKPPPRTTPYSTPGGTPRHSRASSRTLTISDQYDVKLVANTEHLRTSSNSTPTMSRTPSGAPFTSTQERVRGTSGPFVEGFSLGAPSRTVPTSGNFGSIRRTASVAGNPMNQPYSPARHGSIGLWTPPVAPEEVIEDPTDDMMLNFGDDSAAISSPTIEVFPTMGKNDAEEDDLAPLGLWGAPRPPGEAERIREIAPKRRWTVNEKSVA